MVVTAPSFTEPFEWSEENEPLFLEGVLKAISLPDMDADPLRSIILARLKSELSNRGGDHSLRFQAVWTTVCRDEFLTEGTDQYEDRLEIAKSEWTNVYIWAADAGYFETPAAEEETEL